MLRSGAARRKVQRELRTSQPPRCLVPARRGRRQPHAHRRHRHLRRPQSPLLRCGRHGQGKAPSRPALPAGGPLRPAGFGAAGVGGRPALQHRLPPSPHRAPRTGRRRRAARLGGARHGSAARPIQTAVGDLGGRGPRARTVGADLQDPPCPRGRGGGQRPSGGHDGHLPAADAPRRGRLVSPTGAERRDAGHRGHDRPGPQPLRAVPRPAGEHAGAARRPVTGGRGGPRPVVAGRPGPTDADLEPQRPPRPPSPVCVGIDHR